MISPDHSPRVLFMQGVNAGYYPTVPVLKDVSLRVAENKVTVVLGPNGSGKSTCLRVLLGYLIPASGKTWLGDKDITTVPPYQRLEHGIAFLPQGRSGFLELTVQENLELGGWIFRSNRHRFRQAIETTYERYPSLKDLRKKIVGSLSGGQQRMVEIARMMVTDAPILLIDEPSAGLAPIIASRIYEEIQKLKEDNKTILLVDQNVRVAVDLADYIYCLEFGRNNVEGEQSEFEGNLAALVKGWLKIGKNSSD
jgi:branched-chain amino acid transport system ATP-binding protein